MKYVKVVWVPSYIYIPMETPDNVTDEDGGQDGEDVKCISVTGSY